MLHSGTRLNPSETPLAILAEGCFGANESKTAIGVIRYGRWPVTAVIDSSLAGKRVGDTIKGSQFSEVPIVDSLASAIMLEPKPKALLIGTAPMGGDLPDSFRLVVREAIERGLHVLSGLHIFLNDQPDLKALADKNSVMLWDVRSVPDESIITKQLPRPGSVKVITMVGSDCSVGKMSVALEIDKTLSSRGESSSFVATGQTGIMISGSGVPLDRAIGDFMAGLMERAIDEAIRAESPDWVIVEGQGSLLHPAYSGVTLALLHGSAPDGMILCHNPRLKTINRFEKVPLPSMLKLIEIYESAASWIKPSKIYGIALNTSTYSSSEAQVIIKTYEDETGLPVTDAVRYGADKLVDALTVSFY